jgi:hypothetical protein
MRKLLTLVATAVMLAILPSASSAATACKPPRGPGDNLLHSTHLRAYPVSCHIARVVVLRLTRHRAWLEGLEGFYVAGRRWVFAGPVGDGVLALGLSSTEVAAARPPAPSRVATARVRSAELTPSLEPARLDPGPNGARTRTAWFRSCPSK